MASSTSVVETHPLPIKSPVEVEHIDLWVTGSTATATTMERKSMVYVTQDPNRTRVSFCCMDWGKIAFAQRPWKCPWRRQIKVRQRESYNVWFRAEEVKHRDLADHLLRTYCIQRGFFFKLLFRCQRNTWVFKHDLHGRCSPHGKVLLQSVQMVAVRNRPPLGTQRSCSSESWTLWSHVPLITCQWCQGGWCWSESLSQDILSTRPESMVHLFIKPTFPILRRLKRDLLSVLSCLITSGWSWRRGKLFSGVQWKCRRWESRIGARDRT